MIEIISISLFFLLSVIISKVCEKLLTKKDIDHFITQQQCKTTEEIIGRIVDYDKEGNIIYMEGVGYRLN